MAGINTDPFGQINGLGGRGIQSTPFGLTSGVQQRQLENRLQNVRPTDLTRAQETQHETKVGDQVDIPFEPEVDEAEATERLEAEGAQGLESAAQAADAESTQGLDGEAHAADAEATLSTEGEKPPDMNAELEEVRRKFGSALSGTPTSLLGSSNAAGILNPDHQAPGTSNKLFGSIREGFSSVRDGLSSMRDRLFSPPPSGSPFGTPFAARMGSPFAASPPPFAASPTDGMQSAPFVAGPSPGMSKGMKWLGAAAIGTAALSAFAPFMFGMPMMSGFGMSPLSMGLMGLSTMLVPMMAMMSTSMMMAQNAMPPPMMGAMPYAMGPMPYPMQMPNPWTQSSVPPVPTQTVSSRPTPMPGAPPQSQIVPGATLDLTDRQKATLATLPAESQQNFQHLWQTFQGKEVTLPGRTDRVNVNAALAQLLDSERSDVKDKNGTDLLGNLARMSTQEMAPGLDRSALTAQAIVHTAYPQATMTSNWQCPQEIATVEQTLVNRNPSEYVRVASGLASPQGRVELASGRTIARPDYAPHEDGSGRTGVSRLVQTSLDELNVADRRSLYQSPGWQPFEGYSKPADRSGTESNRLHTDALGYGEKEAAPVQLNRWQRAQQREKQLGQQAEISSFVSAQSQGASPRLQAALDNLTSAMNDATPEVTDALKSRLDASQATADKIRAQGRDVHPVAAFAYDAIDNHATLRNTPKVGSALYGLRDALRQDAADRLGGAERAATLAQGRLDEAKGALPTQQQQDVDAIRQQVDDRLAAHARSSLSWLQRDATAEHASALRDWARAQPQSAEVRELAAAADHVLSTRQASEAAGAEERAAHATPYHAPSALETFSHAYRQLSSEQQSAINAIAVRANKGANLDRHAGDLHCGEDFVRQVGDWVATQPPDRHLSALAATTKPALGQLAYEVSQRPYRDSDWL